MKKECNTNDDANTLNVKQNILNRYSVKHLGIHVLIAVLEKK